MADLSQNQHSKAGGRVGEKRRNAMSVIVYGPQGCGKTQAAEVLRRHFRLRQVIDDWVPGDPLPEDTLALTHSCAVSGAVHFDDVMRAVNSA